MAAFSVSATPHPHAHAPSTHSIITPCLFRKPQFTIKQPLGLSILVSNLTTLGLAPCAAAAGQQNTRPANKQRRPNNSKRKKNRNVGGGGGATSDGSTSSGLNLEYNVDFEIEDEGNEDKRSSQRYQQSLPLPKPPAGFIVDGQGRVLVVSDKRVATIVDSTNNFPLECIIRRVFTSSQGEECMLLCPVDMPVQILKSTNYDGWSAVSDDEVEAILPTAAYALAKIHMHLVYSGFCYTARGGFCYTEDDIFEFRTDDGQDVDGLPTEGIEITCFHLDGSHYMIYTPSDPLLFVAAKDEKGNLQIADDELLEDPAIINAIDEETEFNALVEEEAALLESLLGKR